MKDNQILKVIGGVLLVLISLPTFGMSTFMAGGMMGYYGYGGFSMMGIFVSLMILGFGIYLIFKGFE